MTTPKTKSFDVAPVIDNMRDLIKASVKAQRSSDKQGGRVSNGLMLLAKKFQAKETIGTVWIAGDEHSAKFMAACKVEELWIKSSEARALQCDKSPRCWTQAKSNIKAAINYGLDLSKYTTESALRKDVGKKRKELAGVDPLAAAFAAFKKDLESLPETAAIELMQQLTVLAKQAIHELVPVAPTPIAADVDLMATVANIADKQDATDTAIVADQVARLQGSNMVAAQQ